MSNMQIVFVPDLKLKRPSREVNSEEFGEELNEYTKSMLTKMYSLNGVGLSAVQVGDLRRILVADVNSSSEPIVLINPKIINRSEETVTFNEGCISIPDFSTAVDRAEKITVQYVTPFGEPKEREFLGVESVVVQHEVDHLNGVTLLDKVSRLKKNIYIKKLNKFKKRVKKKIEDSKRSYI